MKTDAPAWLLWIERAVAVAALAVVAWAAFTAWGAVVHGHPAYAVLLALTALVAAALGAGTWLWRRTGRRGWRRGLRLTGVVGAVAWVAVIAWLRPFPAVEPAVSAMESDAAVTVTESATEIVLAPASGGSGVALNFQPGARVDPRAYVAVLRPAAEAGHTVVITKQPLGIGFLALGGYDAARSHAPDAEWVVGGHSLGGTSAALTAESADAPPAGLLFFASYPAGDMSDFAGAVLSISGSEDGLARPGDIDASRTNLPGDAIYVVIEGGTHAQFGSYGLQPGDGTALISNDEARDHVAAATAEFLDSLARG